MIARCAPHTSHPAAASPGADRSYITFHVTAAAFEFTPTLSQNGSYAGDYTRPSRSLPLFYAQLSTHMKSDESGKSTLRNMNNHDLQPSTNHARQCASKGHAESIVHGANQNFACDCETSA